MYTIDTSVWVNATEPTEAGHADSYRLLSTLRARAVPIIVSSLVLVEIAGTLSRIRTTARGLRLVGIVQRLRAVTFIPLDNGFTQRAFTIAAHHRLRGADAVYAAVAQQHSTTLVSLDREHLTRLVGVVPVQTPSVAFASLTSGAP